MLMQEAKPYVRFYYEAREDRAASIEAGVYVARDVAMVEVTPVGGKNVHIDEAAGWLKKIKESSHQGRYKPEWVRDFEEMFRMFKEGEEIPESGIPIKTCIMFSPAEQRAILNANVRTLEDLAGCTEEALQAMGPGGRALRDRARTSIEQSRDSGKIAREMEDLRLKNEALTNQVQELLEALNKSGVTRETLKMKAK